MLSFDETHWPLLILTGRGGIGGTTYLDALRQHDDILARNERYVLIVDVADARSLDAKDMKAQADWTKRNAEQLVRLNLGTAFVLDSPLLRGAFKAMLWLQPIPHPHKVVGTFSEGLQWVQERASLGKIVLPPNVKASLKIY